MTSFSRLRRRMIARQIRGRGITDARVLAAMGSVPRELFVSADDTELAYADRPLPIGVKQTISQPYIVAAMIEALRLKGGESVLEVGAGSGYAAAVLSRIAGRVIAIERVGELAERAKANLAIAGIGNVSIRHADGSAGAPDEAPFDAILVSAAASEIPLPLLQQLAISGHMVVPVGEPGEPQKLMRITHTGDDTYDREVIFGVRFVPLVAKCA